MKRFVLACAFLLALPALAAAATTQLVWGGTIVTNLSTSTTDYIAIGQRQNANTTEASAASLWCASGTITRLSIFLPTAPGAAKTRTFTVRHATTVAGLADTSMTVAYANTNGAATTTTGSFAITAGDFIDVSDATTAGSTGSLVSVVLEFQPTTANETCLSGLNTTAPSTSATNLIGFNGTGAWATVDTNHRSVSPLAGTITGLYVALTTAPDNGAGTQQYTFSVNKNGSSLSATNVVISEASTTGNETSSSSAVAAGDYFNLNSVPSGTPASTGTIYYSAKVTTTTAGESWVGGFSGSNTPASGQTSYPDVSCCMLSSAFNNTESTRGRLYGGNTSFTLKKMYVLDYAGDPGNGVTLTFNSRLTGAAGAQSCTITAASGTYHCADGGAGDTVTSTDYITFQTIESAAPTTNAKLSWAFIAYIAPPANATLHNMLTVGAGQ